jgi:adenosylcobinamide-GDP ribazoletransferase
MRPVAALVHEVRLIFTAIQFLTRCPVPAWVGHDPAWLNQCVRWFPWVGAAVGAAGAAVLWGAGMLWPPAVAAVLCVMATVCITGAFHEDGLADTFDALGGVVSRERALDIMKDSRIGSYGAVALVLVLGARVAALAALAAHSLSGAAAAVVAVHALGRGAAVGVLATLPYAGDVEHAKAKPLATAVSSGPAWTGLLTCLAVPALLAAVQGHPLRWLAAVLVVAAVAMLLRSWLRSRLGGYTGDTLGAVEQLTELAALLALSAS